MATETESGRVTPLRDRYPVKEMVRRGWIRGSADPAELEQQLRDFLGMGPNDTKPKLPPGILCGGFGCIHTGEL